MGFILITQKKALNTKNVFRKCPGLASPATQKGDAGNTPSVLQVTGTRNKARLKTLHKYICSSQILF